MLAPEKDTPRDLDTWQSDPTATEFSRISLALAKSDIKDCGEFYYKYRNDSEFLTACTRDGKEWEYFVVDVKIDVVTPISGGNIISPY